MSDVFDIVLRTRGDLAEDGINGRRVAAMVANGQLILLRPGVFVSATEWNELTPERRMVASARALSQISRKPQVHAHLTAAAAHGLPVARADTKKVHTVDAGARSNAVAGVVRHRGTVLDEDVVHIGGITCTGLARTIADVARSCAAETAVSIADAALRAVAYRGPSTYLRDAAEALRSEALVLATRSPRGAARARKILEFADGRAQLPGESVSRLYLVRLGFAPPRLQVPVAAPHGAWYYVDFGLDEIQAFGEFDGEGKYSDPAMLNGRSPRRALTDEKEREDWIRGTTRWAFGRWRSPDIRTVETLGARLTSFGMRPPDT